MNQNWPNEIKELGNQILKKIQSHNLAPNHDDVFRAFELDPYQIKIVILGQDPYPKKGVANGLAFATNESQTPASLKQIFNEIKKFRGALKAQNNLLHWHNQNIMLLNTALTTLINTINAHSLIWKEFTNKVIQFLDQVNPEIVWVLWGNHAKSYQSLIKRSTKIVHDAHPSPLSRAYRKGDSFQKISNYLEVDW